MEPKPKERIVFDEDPYYGAEGEKMAVNDLMERKGLTEDEVREDFTDDEIFNHQMEMKAFDYEDYLPLEGLTAMGKHYELGAENRFIHDLYNSPELCATPPVTWNSPSDALLRNTRKRKRRSLTTSPPANGVCILSTPESVTVSMVA